jgi:hypothetical protein
MRCYQRALPNSHTILVVESNRDFFFIWLAITSKKHCHEVVFMFLMKDLRVIKHHCEYNMNVNNIPQNIVSPAEHCYGSE